jgi:hypothetical protein
MLLGDGLDCRESRLMRLAVPRIEVGAPTRQDTGAYEPLGRVGLWRLARQLRPKTIAHMEGVYASGTAKYCRDLLAAVAWRRCASLMGGVEKVARP